MQTVTTRDKRMFVGRYKWLGFGIMIAAAIPGVISGVLAYNEIISIEDAHTIVLWCVGVALVGWALHMAAVFQQRKEKRDPRSDNTN